jgi:hypothetical protein
MPGMAQFRIVCDDDDKARWQRAANNDGGRSLSSWIRARLNDAAAAELSEQPAKKKAVRPKRS